MITNLIDRFVSGTSPESISRIIGSVPRTLFDRKNSISFRQTVRWAYSRSPFYKKRFDELGINANNIRRPEDLGSFYTTSQDIAENAESFLTGKPGIVFESSGTTGRNKRVFFTQKELDDIGTLNAAGMYLGGITKEDRLVNAFDFSIWIPGMVTQKGIEKAGIFSMVAGKVDPVEVYKRLPVYNFNVIFGEPTWLIKLTEIAERQGSYPLKLIIGGGEEMPDSARPWMKDIWKGAEVRMVYASVESGDVIAFEVFADCGAYHINEHSFLVEVVDPDKDGYGEVVFTTMNRTLMPLVRYKNRDISRIIDEPCTCGLPFRRLARIRGRTDEMIVASGGNLYPLMFEDIFKDVKGLSTDWQIVFKLRGLKEIMEINLELKEDEPRERVKAYIIARIKRLYPDLWKNMELGIFDTDYIFHAPGTLRLNRKLVRLVDKRYAK